ncbi:SNF2-related protein [Flavobacteriaceae bacterium]|nr:SNF2-related protein [Flavobacteriaceae bacterium]
MDSKTQDFLQKIKDKGYWDDNLDYSKGVYKGSREPFEVWCKIHKVEVTKKTSRQLFSHKGCQLCGYDKTANKRKSISIKNFLKEAPIKFKSQFIYDENFSKSLGDEMEIYCKKHNQKFLQTPTAHLFSTTKCSSCRKEKLEKQYSKRRMPLNEYVPKASNNNNNKYTYKNAKQFKNMGDNITITCPVHGDISVNAGNHLYGSGCPKCSGNFKRTTKSFLDELREKGVLFKNYDYSLVEYKSKHVKVIVIDKKFNSRHLLFPSALLNGTKCQGINLEEGYWKFLKARDFIWSLGFNSIKEWKDYYNSGDKPHYIPIDISKEYKNNKDWLSVPDFLGYKKGYKYLDYLSWEDALEYVHALNLNSQDEWYEYVKSGKLPNNIPSNPDKHYSEFISLSHWLGYLGKKDTIWTKQAILSFIKNLEFELQTLDRIELITIINSNNLAKKIKDLGYLQDLISTNSGSKKREEVIQNIIGSIETKVDSDLTDNETENGNLEVLDYELTEFDIDSYLDEIEDEEGELKDLKPVEQLKYFDNKYIIASLDNENIDFLLKNQLKKLWNNYLNKKITLEQLKNEKGGKNFNQIRDWFNKEHEEIERIKPPSDYVFEFEPNDMQKLITLRLKNEKRYGNWSGTGAGKTLAAIFSGRYLNLKNTIIICNNATVSGWLKSSQEYFNNSNVFVKTKIELNEKDQITYKYNEINKYAFKLPENQFNYVILNYETFQLGDGDLIVSEMLKNNNIDYIILDEVQNVKQRSKKNESTRRNVINKLVIHSREKNPNLHLTAMSATPVINNLTEPKKLIELLTGEAHNELKEKDSIANGVEMYKYLTRLGLRYKPNFNIDINTEIIESDGLHLIDKLVKVPKGSTIEFEKIFLQTKLESIKSYLKKGTLIYTYYVTGFIKEIGEFIGNLGFTYGYYTGSDKTGLDLFLKNKVDILIGSAPVSTGVDGIQKVCDRLIPLVLPWTGSEYEQLIGRVNRQGSKFKNVDIFIPQVNVEMDTKTWSHDKRKLNIIEYKSSLADLAVDGEIPKSLAPSNSTLIEQAKHELSAWMVRIENEDIITFKREELKIPLNPNQLEYKKNQLGDFSELNKTWSVSRSENTFKRLKKDKSEWYYYHTLYSEKRKEWDEIPYEEIAKKIQERPDWVIADMGCGENLLSKEIENKVHAFDYVALEGEDVVACDMTNVPLGDQEVDAVVFSLSLMGSNHIDYLKEGFRILKPYGSLFICEPKKKAEARMENLKKEIEDCGFKIIDIKPSSQFIYFNAVKV